MILANAAGERIASVEDWLRLAGPKRGAAQWKPGYSAMELARSWFRGGMPACPEELLCLLETAFPGVKVQAGIGELQVPLDDFRGETRNCDLALDAVCGAARVAVHVEAKAGETAGPLIAEYLREKAGTRSKVPARIDGLARALFGRCCDDAIGALRYQFLHGAAAALIWADSRQVPHAVFVLHEFRSARIGAERLAANAADFERFAHAFPELRAEVIVRGKLYGPLRAPGFGRVPAGGTLWIGKASVAVDGGA